VTVEIQEVEVAANISELRGNVGYGRFSDSSAEDLENVIIERITRRFIIYS